MKIARAMTVLIASTCLAAPCAAQVGSTYESDVAVGDQVQTRQSHASEQLQTDAIRVSELMGLNVENPKGESIGEINDLALNVENGKIAYVAMSVGGLLGIGDELFAIPYDAFAIKPTEQEADATSGQGGQVADDLGDFVAVLDVNEETFEDAEGFDQDNWPNMADPQWRKATAERFAEARKSRMQDPRYAATAEQRRLEDQQDRQQLKTFATYRASEMIGLNFDVDQAENTAEVQDVVIDADTGKIKYVAVTLDDKYYAMPLEAVQVTKNADEELVVTTTAGKQWFDSAQPFDEENWPGTKASRTAAGGSSELR